MKTYTVALLPGDGIGEEVCREAVKVLNVVAQKHGFALEFRHGLVGGAAWDIHKDHFPQETKDLIQSCEAVLFGSVGGPVDAQNDPQWKDCERNSILALRKFLNLRINLRPATVWPELTDFCPLRPDILGQDGFEILVVRELSGGIYFGEHRRPTPDSAEDTAHYDRATIEHIARAAFSAAHNRNKKVTSVDKANVLETSRLWREVFINVAADFPDVELEHMYVDNAVQQIVRSPRSFDVIACPNLFGDIISDLTSVLPGSLGLLPSASLGEGIHLYEPSGGSAPTLAGLNVANPIAQILSGAMMLRFSFGEEDAATDIERATHAAIAAGNRTGELYREGGGHTKVSTSEMGEAICEMLNT